MLQGSSHKFSVHPGQASGVWQWPLTHSKFPEYIEFLTFSGSTGLVTVPQNSCFFLFFPGISNVILFIRVAVDVIS